LFIHVIVGLQLQTTLARALGVWQFQKWQCQEAKEVSVCASDAGGYIGLKAPRASAILEPNLENSRIPEISSKKL
jgi:hypothetical protein